LGRWDTKKISGIEFQKIKMESFFPKSHVKLSQQQQLTKKEGELYKKEGGVLKLM
jgi:hypothetical protein